MVQNIVDPFTGLKKRYSDDGAAGVSNAFIPSSYPGKISSSEPGTIYAIPSGVTAILFEVLTVVAAGVVNYGLVAFGTSSADAQNNLVKLGSTPNIIATVGLVLGCGVTVGANQIDPRGVPEGATHFALGNGVAATTVQVMVTPGRTG